MSIAVERLKPLDELFGRAVADGTIPGAVVGVATRDDVIYLRAFGFRDREAGVAMTEDTVFRTASMTKPVVAAAALSLADAGKLLLSRPIGTYLPELHDLRLGVEENGTLRTEKTVQPTVLDLLRQTSGFTNLGAGNSLVHAAYADAPNLRDHQQSNGELVHKLAVLPLNYRPGTTFEYGMAMDVLGALLEVVAGDDLDAIVRATVGAPLGMADSGFLVRDETRLAEPQIDRATGTRPDLGYQKGQKPRWFRGGGGLLSTAPDYLRFCRVLLNGGTLDGARVLAPATVRRMMTPALPPGVAYSPNTTGHGWMAPLPALGQSFGLGGMVRTVAGPHPWPGSVGDYSWSGRAGTYFWVDPVAGVAAVSMMQSTVWRSEASELLRNVVYGAVE